VSFNRAASSRGKVGEATTSLERSRCDQERACHAFKLSVKAVTTLTGSRKLSRLLALALLALGCAKDPSPSAMTGGGDTPIVKPTKWAPLQQKRVRYKGG
jgi:hypothetical protein